MKCPNCGVEYDDNERVCPVCGAKRSTASYAGQSYTIYDWTEKFPEVAAQQAASAESLTPDSTESPSEESPARFPRPPLTSPTESSIPDRPIGGRMGSSQPAWGGQTDTPTGEQPDFPRSTWGSQTETPTGEKTEPSQPASSAQEQPVVASSAAKQQRPSSLVPSQSSSPSVSRDALRQYRSRNTNRAPAFVSVPVTERSKRKSSTGLAIFLVVIICVVITALYFALSHWVDNLQNSFSTYASYDTSSTPNDEDGDYFTPVDDVSPFAGMWALTEEKDYMVELCLQEDSSYQLIVSNRLGETAFTYTLSGNFEMYYMDPADGWAHEDLSEKQYDCFEIDMDWPDAPITTGTVPEDLQGDQQQLIDDLFSEEDTDEGGWGDSATTDFEQRYFSVLFYRDREDNNAGLLEDYWGETVFLPYEAPIPCEKYEMTFT